MRPIYLFNCNARRHMGLNTVTNIEQQNMLLQKWHGSKYKTPLPGKIEQKRWIFKNAWSKPKNGIKAKMKI